MAYLKKKYLIGLLLLSILLFSSCATSSTGRYGVDRESMSQYPRVSESADILLELHSNIQKTTFFIDGKKMGTGRRMHVLIDNKPHTITALPEGYREKEDFIQPPYKHNSLMSFTFLLEDKLIVTTEEEIVIEVTIQGIDDGVKTTKQQDYKEAVLFAKREAIERAGVEIKSKSTVRNLLLEEDFIQAQSEALLQPGYQIMDVGYDKDGVYRVILIGKIKVKKKKY